MSKPHQVYRSELSVLWQLDAVKESQLSSGAKPAQASQEESGRGHVQQALLGGGGGLGGGCGGSGYGHHLYRCVLSELSQLVPDCASQLSGGASAAHALQSLIPRGHVQHRQPEGGEGGGEGGSGHHR